MLVEEELPEELPEDFDPEVETPELAEAEALADDPKRARALLGELDSAIAKEMNRHVEAALHGDPAAKNYGDRLGYFGAPALADREIGRVSTALIGREIVDMFFRVETDPSFLAEFSPPSVFSSRVVYRIDFNLWVLIGLSQDPYLWFLGATIVAFVQSDGRWREAMAYRLGGPLRGAHAFAAAFVLYCTFAEPHGIAFVGAIFHLFGVGSL